MQADSADCGALSRGKEDVRDSTPPQHDLTPGDRPKLPDRRSGLKRRALRNSLQLMQDHAQYPDRQLFPARCLYLIIAMAVSIIGAMVAAQQSPPDMLAGHFGFAIIALLGGNFLHPYVHERKRLGRAIGVAAFVIVPLGFFGTAMTQWAVQGSLGWDGAIAFMLLVSMIAAVYLRRHPGVMFAGQMAVWYAVVLEQGSLAGVVALGIAVIVALLVSIEQFRIDQKEDRDHEVRARLQTRASEILSDYEETRQGWFWETDRRGLLTYISAPIAQTMGVKADELCGQPFTVLFDLEATGAESQRTLNFHLSSCSAFTELPLRAAIGDRELWWSISGRAYFDNFDNFVGFRGSGADLTESRRSQQRASRLAAYDSLTGLANRHQMSQVLEKILAGRIEANRACVIMLLDLDRFKRVNDTMGHPAGDALLVQVARRLEAAVGNLGRVGRLGGDEFKIILPGRVDDAALKSLAETIIAVLSQPFTIDGKRVVIGASIGITRTPEDGESNEVLIRNADLALYAAKDAGRGRYHFYAEDLHADAEARAEIESDLRDAIARNELSLVYQPHVDTATETITGFEALLRWQHPMRGRVSPNHFISIAEESGLICEIGEWALYQACKDLSRWPANINVSVNVSPLQFAKTEFPAIVAGAIAKAGVDPSRLELEITESVFLSDDQGAEAMFAALKEVGVRLALDDFGTGYSSLGYLKQAPFDKIKIDRSFVSGITDPGSRNGAIIASITGLAHALGMETIAEGVETMDQLELVRLYGCSHVQGFIYERPMTAEAACAKLSTGLTTIARGPRHTRLPRQIHQRRVVLRYKGQDYQGTMRNVSLSGAMIEGLWNVPRDTRFDIILSDYVSLGCITRWCEENRVGVEFDRLLERGDDGRILSLDYAGSENSEPVKALRAG